MKLGLFTVLFNQISLDEVIRKVKPLGIQALEFGAGGYATPKHIDLGLLNNRQAAKDFVTKLDGEGIEISALNCAGNVLHPNRETAEAHIKAFENGIKFAEMLGVRTVINFSGCPGDCETAKYPSFRLHQLAP